MPKTAFAFLLLTPVSQGRSGEGRVPDPFCLEPDNDVAGRRQP